MVPPPNDGLRAWGLPGGLSLSLDRPRLIAILNVTPDSFHDGGRWMDRDAAVEQGLALREAGADVIEVGAESTRPGAGRVDAPTQIARAVPVIEALASTLDVPLAIDTTRSEVAEAALRAGASIVNDVSGGLEDPALLEVAAAAEAGLILMHRLRPPGEDSYSDAYEHAPVYDDVVETVATFLEERAAAAELAGVARDAIVIDPGLGFGKSLEDNFRLIAVAAEIQHHGNRPVLSAASRKSFIGAIADEPNPADRLPGSLAVSVAHALAGIRLFRVHDPAAHWQALAVTWATLHAWSAR